MRVWALAAFTILAAADPLSAAVIRVPEDVSSVLAASDLAVAGDSILVGPGTWTEHETRTIPFNGIPTTLTANAFLKGGVSLIGEAGPEVTTLVGGPPTPGGVIQIADQLAGPVLVEGLTLTGPESTIDVGSSSPVTVRNCRLVDSGVGMRIAGTGAVIEDCVISGHDGSPTNVIASGIDQCCANLTILRTEFTGNENRMCVAAFGISTTLPYTLTIRDCFFHDNRTTGVSLHDISWVEIENNLFLRNSGIGNGGGVSAVDCSGEIRFNVFAWDSVAGLGNGGGIDLLRTSINVLNNTFYGCHATNVDAAAAVSVLTNFAFQFRDNVIAHSTGVTALRNYGSFVPMNGCNYFHANEFFDPARWPPAPTDVFADPLFCDPVQGDFRLQEDSPCAEENNPSCGQVGALGIGCGTVGLDAESFSKIKAGFRQGGGEP